MHILDRDSQILPKHYFICISLFLDPRISLCASLCHLQMKSLPALQEKGDDKYFRAQKHPDNSLSAVDESSAARQENAALKFLENSTE